MIKRITKYFENINDTVLKIVNYGLCFSFFTCLIGIFFLLTYNTYPSSYDFYKGGIILFKTGISFIATFIACGLVFNNIQKN